MKKTHHPGTSLAVILVLVVSTFVAGCDSDSSSSGDTHQISNGSGATSSGTGGSSTGGDSNGSSASGGTSQTGGNGGSTQSAGAGGVATGGESGGGGISNGTGGTAGTASLDIWDSVKECQWDTDCQVINDCCTCEVIPSSQTPVSCQEECAAGSCLTKGFDGSPAPGCELGRCVFRATGTNAADYCPDLQCGPGEVKVMGDTCPTSCVAATEVAWATSCSDCSGDSLCFYVPPWDFEEAFICVPNYPQCEADTMCECIGKSYCHSYCGLTACSYPTQGDIGEIECDCSDILALLRRQPKVKCRSAFTWRVSSPRKSG